MATAAICVAGFLFHSGTVCADQLSDLERQIQRREDYIARLERDIEERKDELLFWERVVDDDSAMLAPVPVELLGSKQRIVEWVRKHGKGYYIPHPRTEMPYIAVSRKKYKKWFIRNFRDDYTYEELARKWSKTLDTSDALLRHLEFRTLTEERYTLLTRELKFEIVQAELDDLRSELDRKRPTPLSGPIRSPYRRVGGKMLRGNNLDVGYKRPDVRGQDVTPSEKAELAILLCKDACDSHELCRSFDYGVHLPGCYLNHKKAGDRAANGNVLELEDHDDWDYYEKVFP